MSGMAVVGSTCSKRTDQTELPKAGFLCQMLLSLELRLSLAYEKKIGVSRLGLSLYRKRYFTLGNILNGNRAIEGKGIERRDPARSSTRAVSL